MESVEMGQFTFKERIRAIMCFGPATPTTGFRAGDYYQVTIDPNMCSPSGEYIRFGAYQGDEIQGWQRVAAMTVVEDLGPSDVAMVANLPGYTQKPDAGITLRVVA